MKYARFGLILVGVIFIFSGCEKPGEPDPPTLIAPANDTVFDTLPPAFIWNSDEFADGYKIMIDDDSITSVDCLISIDVEDTTYTMSQKTFDTLENGIYYWVAAACKDPDDNDIGVIAWGESWSFVIQKPEPEPRDPSPPQLIAPADGSVLDTIPPTFTWSADTLTHGYLFRIKTDTSTEIDDSLGDTTWAMTREILDSLAEGTYSWAAATVSNDGEEFWSEAWTFTIERPEPVTDLDTTYFPFGLGYEWCFERHEWGEGGDGGKDWSYDDTTTFIVTVIDSFWEGDTLVFSLETTDVVNNLLGIMPKSLLDMYKWNEARIYNDEIYVWHGYIGLVPDPFTLPSYVSYLGDSLRIREYQSWVNTTYETSIIRLREIGTITQYDHYDACTCIPPISYEEHDLRDRLLYFYNGIDTIYKTD